jgi:hypothetical protein
MIGRRRRSRFGDGPQHGKAFPQANKAPDSSGMIRQTLRGQLQDEGLFPSSRIQNGDCWPISFAGALLIQR